MPPIPDALELARRLIRVKTVNPPGNELECAVILAGMLEEAGFAVELQEISSGRANLAARLTGSHDGPVLGFTGHLDTVPLGRAEWSFDPFAAEVSDGKLLGRGASDMKAGVAAITAAAVRHALESKNRANLVLLFTAGEETGCEGATHIPKITLVPGRLGALVVAEPTSNYPILGHKGALWFKAVAKGITAHGSMPELGDNAIYKAARAALKLENFQFSVPPHPILGRATLNVGTIQGGLNINSVPDYSEIAVDIRTLPSQVNAELLNELGEVLGPEVEVHPLSSSGAVWTNPDQPWIGDVFAIMSGLLGETPEPRSVPYFTDASELTASLGGPPTVILGPGEAGQAHQTNEYCSVDRIYEAVEAYGKIIDQWSVTK